MFAWVPVTSWIALPRSSGSFHRSPRQDEPKSLHYRILMDQVTLSNASLTYPRNFGVDLPLPSTASKRQ
jgi:hypothetical protein